MKMSKEYYPCDDCDFEPNRLGAQYCRKLFRWHEDNPDYEIRFCSLMCPKTYHHYTLV